MKIPVWSGLVLAAMLIVSGLVWRVQALREPAYQGKPVSYWMLQPNPSSELENNEGLAAIGTNALPYLVEAVGRRATWVTKLLERIHPKLPPGVRHRLPRLQTQSEIDQIRGKAIAALRAFGFQAAPALPALYKAFLDENLGIQSSALYTAYQIDPTKEAIPYLVAAWNNTNRFHKGNRGEVIAILEKIGHLDPEAAIPLLIQALDDDTPTVPSNAAVVLGRIGYSAPGVVPKLLRLLEHKGTRAAAAYALGRVTNFCEAAIPPLRRLAQDEDHHVKACAALTLWRFTGESGLALRALDDALEKSKDYRQFLAICLGEMGTAAKPAIPLLLRVAQTTENYSMAPIHRVFAAEAILRIDPSASEATDLIVEALRAPNHRVRQQAAMSLGALGDSVRSAIPALEKALRDEDREVRHHAAIAIQKTESSTNQSVRDL